MTAALNIVHLAALPSLRWREADQTDKLTRLTDKDKKTARYAHRVLVEPSSLTTKYDTATSRHVTLN
jgi:hypothetical protein